MTKDELRRLYWNTKTPVSEIARTLGVEPREVCRLAGPITVLESCELCGRSQTATSREERRSRPGCYGLYANAPIIRRNSCDRCRDAASEVDYANGPASIDFMYERTPEGELILDADGGPIETEAMKLYMAPCGLAGDDAAYEAAVAKFDAHMEAQDYPWMGEREMTGEELSHRLRGGRLS